MRAWSALGAGCAVLFAILGSTVAVKAHGAENVSLDPGATAEAAERPALDLAPVAPNPARTEALIRYRIARATRVRVTILDAAGRVVTVVEDGFRPAGTRVARWAGLTSAGTVATPGLYIARVEADGLVGSRHLVLVQ